MNIPPISDYQAGQLEAISCINKGHSEGLLRYMAKYPGFTDDFRKGFNMEVELHVENTFVDDLFRVGEFRVNKAETTPGYKDWDFVEKSLLRLRPFVQDSTQKKEKWSNLVVRLNKLRYPPG